MCARLHLSRGIIPFAAQTQTTLSQGGTSISTLATTAPAGEVSTADQEAIEALLRQQEAEIDSDLLQTPLLKIGQPLTREVQDEEAEAGEFINTATGEGIGTKVEFIVAYYQKGRFAADRDSNRSYAANGTDVIPDHWSDLVGEEFVGTPFAEYPDAEEQFKARVNRKEIQWGKGPLISTTHVFTGLALVEDVESGEVELQPVRLSLQRTNVPAVKKWMTLRQSKMRNRPFWDKTFVLETEKKTYDKGMAFNLKVGIGRETTADEKEAALALAQAVLHGRVADNSEGAAAEDRAEPKTPEGALGV